MGIVRLGIAYTFLTCASLIVEVHVKAEDSSIDESRSYAAVMDIVGAKHEDELATRLMAVQSGQQAIAGALSKLAEAPLLEESNPRYFKDREIRGEAIRLLGAYRSMESIPTMLRMVSFDPPVSILPSARPYILIRLPAVDALVMLDELAVQPILRYVACFNRPPKGAASNWEIELFAYAMLRIRLNQQLRLDSQTERRPLPAEIRTGLVADIDNARALPRASSERLDLLEDFVKNADLRSYEAPLIPEDAPRPRFDPIRSDSAK